MNPADNLEASIRQLHHHPDDATRRRILSNVLDSLDPNTNPTPDARHPSFWRHIMKNRITKFAAAAAMIAIAAGAFFALTHSATPAWAIEQTIQALENKNIQSLKLNMMFNGTLDFPGIDNLHQVSCTIWAEPDDDEPGSGQLKCELADTVELIVCRIENDYQTYVYNPKENTAYIYSGSKFHIRPWLDADFFNLLKQAVEKQEIKNWQEKIETDNQTGKKYIIVSGTIENSSQKTSFIVKIDFETKLPVSAKQWNNLDFNGPPQFDMHEIEYNPDLPEGIFNFEIPDGATVIDEREDKTEK